MEFSGSGVCCPQCLLPHPWGKARQDEAEESLLGGLPPPPRGEASGYGAEVSREAWALGWEEPWWKIPGLGVGPKTVGSPGSGDPSCRVHPLLHFKPATSGCTVPDSSIHIIHACQVSNFTTG